MEVDTIEDDAMILDVIKHKTFFFQKTQIEQLNYHHNVEEMSKRTFVQN